MCAFRERMCVGTRLMRRGPMWQLTRIGEIMSQARQRRTTPPRRVKELIKGKCQKEKSQQNESETPVYYSLC